MEPNKITLQSHLVYFKKHPGIAHALFIKPFCFCLESKCHTKKQSFLPDNDGSKSCRLFRNIFVTPISKSLKNHNDQMEFVTSS